MSSLSEIRMYMLHFGFELQSSTRNVLTQSPRSAHQIAPGAQPSIRARLEVVVISPLDTFVIYLTAAQNYN